MNIKSLIGCVITIGLLIGLSLTSVGGHNDLDSDIKSSPLFHIRSNLAINSVNNNIDSDFLGEDLDNNLLIPKRDNNLSFYFRLIDKIGNMDKSEIDHLKENLFPKLRNQFKLSYEGINHLSKSLDLLNENTELIKALYSNVPNNDLLERKMIENNTLIPNGIKKESITSKLFDCTINGKWFPFCLATIPLFIIAYLLGVMIVVGVLAIVWPVLFFIIFACQIGNTCHLTY